MSTTRPKAVYEALLDEGIYLCSPRTMYRILDERGEIKERRNQRRHPKYTKPELIAERPNSVWSWDITNLKGPRKGNNYNLYVFIDIFSRYVVGWRVEEVERDELAEDLIRNIYARQRIKKKQLTIHSDRGGPMISELLQELYVELDINSSFNRPHVSNDNPHSESNFKTLTVPNFQRALVRSKTLDASADFSLIGTTMSISTPV